MSYVRIWLHCVWGTKKRYPFFTKDNKKLIIEHIRENAIEKEIYLSKINAHKDHFHILLSLNKEQNISKVMNLIKGESSHWINKYNITKSKFEWADEYFAISISEADLDNVKDYIKNQEEHHRTKSWKEEYEAFINEYSFTRIQG